MSKKKPILGMIVVGYQGIGKTTVSKKHKSCIDLDSSSFKTNSDGHRDPKWYVVYCNYAIELAKQGYTVFVSSHKCVRDELANRIRENYIVVFCYPTLELKDIWIDRLQSRFEKDPNVSNRNAFVNAKNEFSISICDLFRDHRCNYRLAIHHIDYDLYSGIKAIRRRMSLYKSGNIPASSVIDGQYSVTL